MRNRNWLYAVEGRAMNGRTAVKFGYAKHEATCSQRIDNAVDLLRRNGFREITQRNVWRGVIEQESEIHRILRRNYDNIHPINHSDGYTEAYVGLTMSALAGVLPRAGVVGDRPAPRVVSVELVRNVNSQWIAAAAYVLLGGIVWPLILWSILSAGGGG